MLDCIIDFIIKNKLDFKYQDNAIQKHVFVYTKKDILKILSYLYKYHRKYYFKLSHYNQSNRAFINRIFINYLDDYSGMIKNFYIYWNE